MQSICVYAASSESLPEAYRVEARRLGTLIAEHGHQLIYGGGNVGLMGECARAVHQHGGGRVVGVITDKLVDLELAYREADELIITDTMSERKAKMESLADAFITLPGGFGTLDEVMDILVLRQLWYHAKPCVFLNINGVFDHLFLFFDRLIADSLISERHLALYLVCDTAEAAYDYLLAHTPGPAHEPWF